MGGQQKVGAAALADGEGARAFRGGDGQWHQTSRAASGHRSARPRGRAAGSSVASRRTSQAPPHLPRRLLPSSRFSRHPADHMLPLRHGAVYCATAREGQRCDECRRRCPAGARAPEAARRRWHLSSSSARGWPILLSGKRMVSATPLGRKSIGKCRRPICRRRRFCNLQLSRILRQEPALSLSLSLLLASSTIALHCSAVRVGSRPGAWALPRDRQRWR